MQSGDERHPTIPLFTWWRYYRNPMILVTLIVRWLEFYIISHIGWLYRAKPTRNENMYNNYVPKTFVPRNICLAYLPHVFHALEKMHPTIMAFPRNIWCFIFVMTKHWWCLAIKSKRIPSYVNLLKSVVVLQGWWMYSIHSSHAFL